MMSEVTVEVFCSKRKLYSLLKKRGFTFLENFYVTDYYYSTLGTNAKKDTDFKSLINSSVIVRNVKLERRYFTLDGLTTLLYKKKEFDDKGRVISEEKITCEVDNLTQTRKMFSASGMKNWCTKKMIGHEFKNNDYTIYVQEIEGIGLFIEMEQKQDQKGTSAKKISVLKKYLQDLKLPLGDDFNVSIAYRIFKNKGQS